MAITIASAKDNEVILLYEQRMPVYKIRRLLNIGEHTIRKILKENNVHIRNHSEAFGTIEERFNARVIKKEGCWEWTGSKDKDGYGRMGGGYGKNQTFAHRISYELYIGEVPDGKIVCHHCDNPECTNPQHLFMGEVKDNNQDKHNKLRHVYGETHPRTPFTETDIKNIREEAVMKGLNNKTFTEIGTKYGVSRNSIYCICLRKTWRHI